MEATVSQLSEAADDFLIPLRLGDGYIDEKFQRLCQAIRAVNARYNASETIPKNCAITLVELFPLIEGCKSLYGDAVRMKLDMAYATLFDLIGEGLATED